MLRNPVVLPLLLFLVALYSTDVSAISCGRVVPEDVEIQFSADAWQLHIPAGTVGTIEVRYVPEPESVTCLPGTAAVPYRYDNGILRFEGSGSNADGQPRDVVLQWPENRWTKTIQDFEAEDKVMPLMTGGLLFTGSSTARMWNLKKFFPNFSTLNRGFGGSHYWDLVCFAEQILDKHQPETIIVYSGDNDISAGKSPDWVAADCITAITRLHQAAPQSRIIVIGAKPSGSRWELYPAMQETNRLIEQHIKELEKVHFLDLGKLLMGPDGKPDRNYYLEDALHLNDNGYLLWSDALTEFINNTTGH